MTSFDLVHGLWPGILKETPWSATYLSMGLGFRAGRGSLSGLDLVPFLGEKPFFFLFKLELRETVLASSSGMVSSPDELAGCRLYDAPSIWLLWLDVAPHGVLRDGPSPPSPV